MMIIFMCQFQVCVLGSVEFGLVVYELVGVVGELMV